jgi:O-antigen biosynthesis protein WbqP
LIKILDKIIAIIVLFLFLPLMVSVYLYLKKIGIAPIFDQTRIGRFGKKFKILKFRTMPAGTIEAPTHLVPIDHLPPFCVWLRKLKIDELPQLFNVLKGEMSIVGYRPCLVSQIDLCQLRESKRIFNHLPGITGYAQCQGLTMRDHALLVESERLMYEGWSVKRYVSILGMTVVYLFRVAFDGYFPR